MCQSPLWRAGPGSRAAPDRLAVGGSGPGTPTRVIGRPYRPLQLDHAPLVDALLRRQDDAQAGHRIGHALREVDVLLDRAQEPGLLALASQIAAATNQPKLAITLGREALTGYASVGDVDRQATGLADLYMLVGAVRDFETSSLSIRRAFELVKDQPSSRLKAFVLWMFGWERWWADRMDEAIEMLSLSCKIVTVFS